MSHMLDVLRKYQAGELSTTEARAVVTLGLGKSGRLTEAGYHEVARAEREEAIQEFRQAWVDVCPNWLDRQLIEDTVDMAACRVPLETHRYQAATQRLRTVRVQVVRQEVEK